MASPGHPLVDSMRRAGVLNSYFDLPVRVMDQDGWIDAPALFEGDDSRLRDMVLAHGRDHWETENPHAAGSVFISAYLARVTWPVIGLYVLERRIPKVTLDNLAFHRDGQRIVGTALNHPYFAALPGDVAAGHRDAEVVADEAALYNRLKEWLFEANFNPVVSALRRAARASIKVSRNLAGVSCAKPFRWLYSMTDEPERVAQEAYAFFSDPTSPVYREVSVEVFEHQGKRELLYRRAGCCLRWRSPKSSHYCPNCVLVPRERQNERFRELLSRGA